MEPLRDVDFTALTGTVLADKYRLVEVIGAGAMGCVFRAEQVGLGRSVAVKLLLPGRAGAQLDLFRTEALAASRINHPHAVSVYDFGVTKEDGLPYLVMEFLRGRPLSSVIDDGALAPARAATIGAQVLSALAEAHACGVIHRDLKADNIILEPLRDGDDYAKLIDFGIARLAETDDRVDGVAGTPEYMAPEQIRGEPITAATDLYAVGVLLYEMVVGHTPFADAPDVKTLLQAHLSRPPAPAHELNPAVPAALSDLIARALAKDPADRPAGARAMRDALLGAVQTAERTRSCAACGELVGAGARFCPGCGKPIDAGRRRRATVAPPSPPPPPAPSARAPAVRATRLTLHLRSAPDGLVGRNPEYVRVAGFVRGDEDGAALALVGPRGVGKARLVLEAARAPANTRPVWFAGADPTGLAMPWYPVQTMVRALLGLTGRVTRDALASAVDAYGLPERDVPGLCALFGVDGPLDALADDARLREVEAAALRVLVFAHRRHPGSVLAFHDVDRYDIPSAYLVDSLVSRLDGAGTRVVVTASELDRVPKDAAVMDIGPLLPADARALAQMRAPGLDLPDADDIASITGGLPEAIEHFVRWIDAGHSAQRAPDRLVDLIGQRISSLLPAARRVLQAVAIHGTVAPRALVEISHGEFDAVAEAALAELIDDGFVVPGDGDDVALSSELLRDVVRSTTPADVARALHRNALGALAERADTPIAVLAHHAAGARDPDRAFDSCMRAGREALRLFDDTGASRWFARAMELSHEEIAAGRGAAREALADATIELADVLRRLGKRDLATDVLTQAALGEPNARQRAAIARQRGRLALAAGDRAAALRHLRTAVDLAFRAGERGALLAEAYRQLADELLAEGDAPAAVDALREAIQVVTYAEGFACAREVPELWRLGERLARAELAVGDAAAADVTASAAFAYTERVGATAGAIALAVTIADIATARGDMARAHEYRMRAIDAARRAGDRRRAAELLLGHARAAGDHASAKLARTLAGEIGWREGVATAERR